MAYRLSQTAQDQIGAILLHSARNFGLPAADRYSLLILTALDAIGSGDPPPGAIPVAHLAEIHAFPLRLLRTRVAPALRVGVPRHLIIYRIAQDGVAEILGLVHDRMVLARAAARLAR